jgi:hypothetical protein
VPPRITKKQLLLDLFQAGGKRPIEVADLRTARDMLRGALGPTDKTSFGYIASILRQAGYEVRYEDRFSDPIMPEPYATQLKDVLEFHDLTSAEQSLLRINTIYHEYSDIADRRGVELVLALVKKGKLRARSLASNPRVQAAKRQEKEEIASWFQVWLETPELFRDWLELRKTSNEFQNLFGGGEHETGQS